MKNCALLGLIVFTIFMSYSVCIGSEDKSHICFRSIDTNNDGTVTFQEFRKVFGDDKETYDEVDLNRDGKLSHDEYHQALGHGAL